MGNNWKEDVMPFVEELGKVILKSPNLTDKQSKDLWEKFVYDALDNFKRIKKYGNLRDMEQDELSKVTAESADKVYSEFRAA